jgi:hypothetical protein
MNVQHSLLHTTLIYPSIIAAKVPLSTYDTYRPWKSLLWDTIRTFIAIIIDKAAGEDHLARLGIHVGRLNA